MSGRTKNDNASHVADDDETILQCFDQYEHARDRLRVVHEHGQPWIECLDCGAQWGVHEAPGSASGLDFEQVSEGDQWCVESSDGEESEDE